MRLRVARAQAIVKCTGDPRGELNGTNRLCSSRRLSRPYIRQCVRAGQIAAI